MSDDLGELVVCNVDVKVGFYIMGIEGRGVWVVDWWKLCGVSDEDDFVASAACGVVYEVLQKAATSENGFAFAYHGGFICYIYSIRGLVLFEFEGCYTVGVA